MRTHRSQTQSPHSYSIIKSLSFQGDAKDCGLRVLTRSVQVKNQTYFVLSLDWGERDLIIKPASKAVIKTESEQIVVIIINILFIPCF